MRRILCVLMLGVMTAMSVGCASSETDEPEPITKDDVLSDMSPMLVTRSRTSDETDITHARVIDTNGRSMWDDLERIFLLDRPSRQSLYPTP